MIGYNVDSLVEQLSGTMKDVSKVAVKSATKASLKEMLKDEDGNEYQWKNETVVNEELDKLTDALVSDNATVTSVSTLPWTRWRTFTNRKRAKRFRKQIRRKRAKNW